MKIKNEVSITLTPADKQSILDAIAIIVSKLTFLIALLPEDRKDLPKMGNKTLSFVVKTLEHADNNPSTVPPYVNVPELRKDVVAVQEMLNIYNALHQVCESLDDTIMLAGSEAYVASLAYYNSIKGASRAGVVGAKTIADDLKEHFPGRSKKSAQSNNGTPA